MTNHSFHGDQLQNIQDQVVILNPHSFIQQKDVEFLERGSHPGFNGNPFFIVERLVVLVDLPLVISSMAVRQSFKGIEEVFLIHHLLIQIIYDSDRSTAYFLFAVLE